MHECFSWGHCTAQHQVYQLHCVLCSWSWATTHLNYNVNMSSKAGQYRSFVFILGESKDQCITLQMIQKISGLTSSLSSQSRDLLMKVLVGLMRKENHKSIKGKWVHICGDDTNWSKEAYEKGSRHHMSKSPAIW